MEVIVSGTLESAIRALDRKRKACGIERELKARRFPKRSERIHYKAHLAKVRRLKKQKMKGGFTNDRSRKT